MLPTFSQFNRFLPQQLRGPCFQSQNVFSPIKEFVQEQDDFKVSVYHRTYDTPTTKDLLVIIPFFNPCNSVRMLQNMLFVRHKLDQANIPYVVVHCLFPNSVPLGRSSSKYVVVRSNSYAFVKENLANIVINKNVAKYNKFLVHDGDVLFGEHNWYNKVSQALESADIIQPYDSYKNMDINFVNIVREGTSLFKVCCDGKDYEDNNHNGHPGYLIGFTKHFWLTNRYPDETLIGSGDTLICSIALRKKLFAKHHNVNHMEHLYSKYCNDSPVKVSYLEGTIYHMYHNVPINRQYTSRYFILNKYINETTEYKTIDDLISKNKDGVYEWVDDIRDGMNKDILNYFASRQDDEVSTTT